MGRKSRSVARLVVFVALAHSAVRAQEAASPDSGTNQPETVLNGSPSHATCCATDQAGNIWIGTEGGGAWEYISTTKEWHQFTAKDGLGDDVVYALNVDSQGRVWAGHLNHGVSVFNGKAWRNYSNWSGTGEGMIAGPLGDRVFSIATSPVGGDVWIATEAGISRYSAEKHLWTYITRVDGLPENNVRGIAFDRSGNVFLAMATEGVVIGRASDAFAKWEQVKAPAEIPATANGDGIPCNLANCITVNNRDAVYVGTTQGLGYSTDDGRAWRFVRGKDWQDLVNGQRAGAVEKVVSQEEGVLNEDWINCLATDDGGTVWVGFRKLGYERLEPAAMTPILSETDAPPKPDPVDGKQLKKPMNDVVSLAVRGVGEQPLIIRYEPAAAWCTAADAHLTTQGVVKTEAAADLPVAANPPTVEELNALRDQINALKLPSEGVAYLGEDWSTQGDWVGRYGRDHASLLGLYDKPHSTFGNTEAYTISIGAGEHDDLGPHYYYLEGDEAQVRRVLWHPALGSRIQGELNDGSYAQETWPPALDGPGMWIKAAVPEGPRRLAIYFGNFDGQSGNNQFRDFVLEVRRQPDDVNDDTLNDAEKLTSLVLAQPVLAKARVSQFWGGVYERFLLNGKGTYWVRIRRNHSFVTKLQGLFFDRLGEIPAAEVMATDNDPPAFQEPVDLGALAPAIRGSIEFRRAMDAAWNHAGVEMYSSYATLAYRAGFGGGER